MKKYYFSILLFFITFFVLVVGFQNCGKVAIQSPSTLMITNAKNGIGYLCLPEGYTMDSFFITNLNIKTTATGLQIDNDSDGLSDEEEVQLGFNPNLRRTSGKILDSICSMVDYGVNCSNFNLNCSITQNPFGLSECDILALNLNQTVQLGIGIDSDKDGIPDYLEIRINSFPNLADSYSDLDFDLLNNYTEAERGTSTRNSNVNTPITDYVRIAKSKISNTACNGEYWKIDIINLPTLSTKDFTDNSTGLLNLSHAPNENLIMTFLKIKPIDNLTSPAKTFAGLQKVKYDLNNKDTSFKFNQDLLFFTGDVEQ